MTRSIEGGPETESNRPELENLSPVYQLFSDLSKPDTAALVTPDRMESLRGPMVQELSSVGVNFEAVKTPDMQALLRERQFRHPYRDKGLAVSTAIGFDHIAKFQVWAGAESFDLPPLAGQPDSTRSRGLMQMLANTIAFASCAVATDAYLQDLKWRIGASYERPAKKATERAKDDSDEKTNLRQALFKIRQAYTIPGPKNNGHKDYEGYSRVKPESAIQFWGKLKEICSRQHNR